MLHKNISSVSYTSSSNLCKICDPKNGNQCLSPFTYNSGLCYQHLKYKNYSLIKNQFFHCSPVGKQLFSVLFRLLKLLSWKDNTAPNLQRSPAFRKKGRPKNNLLYISSLVLIPQSSYVSNQSESVSVGEGEQAGLRAVTGPGLRKGGLGLVTFLGDGSLADCWWIFVTSSNFSTLSSYLT